MRAIILAAGINRRFFVQTPKSLEPIKAWSNRPYHNMLERTIIQLKQLDISDVVIVVNQRYSAEFDYLCDDNIELLVNRSDVAVTGSTISAIIGLEHFAKFDAEDVLILDADIVISKESLRHLFEHRGASAILVSPKINCDNEEVLVYADAEGQPRLLGKGIGDLMASELEVLGESTGIVRVEKNDIKLALELGKWITGYGQSKAYGFSKTASEHEELWQYFFTLKKMKVALMSDEETYFECDTREDFALLENGLRID